MNLLKRKGLLFVVCCAALTLHAAQPNILFIFADDMSYETIGAYDSRHSERAACPP